MLWGGIVNWQLLSLRSKLLAWDDSPDFSAKSATERMLERCANRDEILLSTRPCFHLRRNPPNFQNRAPWTLAARL